MKLLSTFKRPARTTTVALASAAAGMALAVPGLALATHTGQSVPAPPAVPTSASQIQNIDQVKTAIKGYYGDTIDTRLNPIDGTPLHTFSPTGPYADEMAGVVDDAEKYLRKPNNGDHPHSSATKAVLFDVDDTTLNTYDYEVRSNFVYNPASNATFVDDGAFPAPPYMPQLVTGPPTTGTRSSTSPGGPRAS